MKAYDKKTSAHTENRFFLAFFITPKSTVFETGFYYPLIQNSFVYMVVGCETLLFVKLIKSDTVVQLKAQSSASGGEREKKMSAIER